MLVLSRKVGEKIVIAGDICVTVLAIQGNKARLGIAAPASARVDRLEVHQRLQEFRAASPVLPLPRVPPGEISMPPAQQGDRVQVHYVIRSQDGSGVSSRGRGPLELTVGVDHARLPGLGLALVGLNAGESVTVTVPPERAYGQPDPTRVRRWSRGRFPEPAALRAGQSVRFTDDRGRWRRVRIVRVGSKAVLVDTNHRWAGQALKLQVQLINILGAGAAAPSAGEVPQGTAQGRRARAVAFDVDAASLASLREALPGWEIVTVNGASACSLARDWDPAAADLLVVGVADDATVTLALCRFVAFCTAYSRDALPGIADAVEPRELLKRLRVNAPLLVLVPPGRDALVAGALEAGAHSCLVLPIVPKEVTAVLARVQAGNQPGRHTLKLEQAQVEDRWRDAGGEG
jgi:peptidylprolyl isomerase